MLVRNFKLPEAVEKAMDKRTTLGVFDGKMGEYAQYESVQAMRDAAKNTGMGGMFGAAGIGLGMGARVGNQFAQNLDEAQSAKIKCAKCGASVKAGAKFCPECGAKVGGEATSSKFEILSRMRTAHECNMPQMRSQSQIGHEILSRMRSKNRLIDN